MGKEKKYKSFEEELLEFNVTYNDLTVNKYEFLGVAHGKDGYKGLHVFRKDKEYYYFKFHPDYHILDDTYELIEKKHYQAENIIKE